ncbi:baculoviral IAP repeat-containing protein 5 [Agrilus planipennis]|uniref:Baculoviral IAP repeat-containing protein 5 n=1 Tax=Agrilus planipennis TaxID=224129 RepID=A0A1W4XEC9_AGRPL|nr:baculoviral IAP repeat-containing protein 5 [Agrilus planipennis]
MNDSDFEEFQYKLNLMLEKNRLDSFNNKWVFDDSKPCNAKKLAEAGFYYTGTEEEPDFVQCFFCDKQLVGWEEEDDPWQEHLHRSPQCEFAKHNKLEMELTLAQFIQLREKLVMKLFKKWMSKRDEQFEWMFKMINELKRR